MSHSIRKYPPEITRQKMMQWCDKAERCHYDVRQKLLAWNIPYEERENLIADLIGANLLNEARYAGAFAHDKFEFFNWGVRKIELELKKKHISDAIIRHAIGELDKEDYSKKIHELIKRKEPQHMGLQLYQKKFKLAKYLVSKGFEHDVVWRELDRYPFD